MQRQQGMEVYTWQVGHAKAAGHGRGLALSSSLDDDDDAAAAAVAAACDGGREVAGGAEAWAGAGALGGGQDCIC